MKLFLNGTFTACWARLFRWDIISGFEFPEGLNCEDYIYMYEAIRRLKTVAVINLPLYYYFVRENSIVNESFGIKKFDQYYSAKKLYELVCKHTPQYKKQSLQRLAGAIISLVNSARKHEGFEKQESEMICFLRNNASLFLFNKYIMWKTHILLFSLMLPRDMSAICIRILSESTVKQTLR